MRTISYVVVHHAASYDAERRRVVHQSVELVRRFHKMPLARYVDGKLVRGTGGRGFKDIAYNRYIEVDGTIRMGRPDTVSGAHTELFNHVSLGVCCSGHADFEPFNEAQLASLIMQCVAWCHLYDLTAERVIGHREAPRFGAAPVGKSCPGKLTDMEMVRARVRKALSGVIDDEAPVTRRDGSPKGSG